MVVGVVHHITVSTVRFHSAVAVVVLGTPLKMYPVVDLICQVSDNHSYDEKHGKEYQCLLWNHSQHHKGLIS